MEFILLTAAGTIIFMLVLIAWRDHGRGDVTWYGKYSSQEERRVEDVLVKGRTGRSSMHDWR